MHFLKAALLLILPAALAACNDIDEENRFTGPVDVEAKKNVLIEDFTGQDCVNCPYAADAIHSLQDLYTSNRVVAVSIHGGSLSISEDDQYVTGLATPQGNDYTTHWGVRSFPKGMVDRTGGLLDYEMWSAQVISRFAVEPKVEIEAEQVSFDAGTRTVTLKAAVKAHTAVSGTLNVWLTESHVIAIQAMPTGTYNYDYEHNHVFRRALSAAYGDPLTLDEEETQTKEYTYTLERDSWNADNLSLVIFFENGTDGVMQVIDTPVLSTTHND